MIPPLREVTDGARTTLLLLRLRARAPRSFQAQLGLLVGLALTYLVLLFMANAGTTMRGLAEREAGTPEGEFATTFVLALRAGDLGWVGAVALGSVLVVTLLGPISGAANQSLVPAEDLTGLKVARLHRYFDTWFTTVVSPTGVMQILQLTALASLLTLDGGRTWALLLTWVTWPALVAVMIAAGWGFEWLYRARGARAKGAVTATLIGLVGVAALVDPNNGKTLFGLGQAYADVIHAATEGPTQILPGVLIAALIGVFSVVAGLVACREALSLPEVPERSVSTIRSFRIPRNTVGAILTILGTVVVRTREVRRPIGVLLIMGIPATLAVAFTGKMPEATYPALLAVVPLAVTLGYGVNVFGLLGTSLPFLLSTPRFTHRILPAAFLTNLTLTLVVLLLIAAPIMVTNPAGAVRFGGGAIVTSVLATVLGLRKSVTNPVRARQTSRGNPTLPPMTAINYSIRLMGPALAGILTVAAPHPYSWLLALTALAWAVYRYVHVASVWANPETQSRVAAEVAPG